MVAGNGDVAPPSWTWFGTSGVTPQEEWEFRLRYCAVFADSLILGVLCGFGMGVRATGTPSLKDFATRATRARSLPIVDDVL